MKKIIVVIIIGLTVIASCKKSFLDEADPAKISPLSYYKTAADMQAAVNASYAGLQAVYYNWFIYGDVASDNAYTSGAASSSLQGEFDLPPVSTTNFNLSNTWNESYRSISRANIVLNKIEGASLDANMKKAFTGQAKFIRALNYFNLVRMFGAVPLVLTEIPSSEEAFAYARETVPNIYTQIIKDLKEAEQELPVSFPAAESGKATSGAAKVILGKVYLTQKKYTEAAAKLKEVIDAGTYALLPVYDDVFKPSNGQNKEVVFAVNYKKGGIGEGSPWANVFVPNQSGNAITPVGVAGGYAQVTEDFDQAFEANDLRKSISVGVYQTVFKYTRKYLDVPTANVDSDNDWIVTRYADVLLMYAEALNESGNVTLAIDYLNMIRKRANLIERTIVDIPDQAAFRLAVEKERRVELGFEGHRWFDLLRTERAQTVMNAYFIKENVKRNGTFVVLQNYMLVFPIPTAQVNINPEKIPQNTGY
jgi:tetratricopeptide (TPR) repeat protein